MHKGSCLCGAITFTVEGELSAPSACHCSRCRKHTGHYEAGTDVPRAAVSIAGEEHVTWYRSSERIRRGFCSVCGSSLFFDIVDHDRFGLSMGAFDTPTKTALSMHIFVANKGDYYDIADGVPQHNTIPEGLTRLLQAQKKPPGLPGGLSHFNRPKDQAERFLL